MKGVKGKILKKLKSSMKPIEGYLKIDDSVLQFNAADNFVKILQKNPILKAQNLFLHKEGESESYCHVDNQISTVLKVNDHQAPISNDVKQEEEEEDEIDENKENIGQPNDSNGSFSRKETQPLSEIDVSSFRRPDLNSFTLFDPNLLDAFEQAVKEHFNRVKHKSREIKQVRNNDDEEEEEDEMPPIKSRRVLTNPLFEYEEKCPPGGEDSVILYTTTLGGIRKTLEDCNRTRFLLQTFKIVFFERDVSMHREYREEMWRVIGGNERAIPPRLFIKGRYIGGVDEILGLHEQGKLKPLFNGVPIETSNGCCEACGGIRFVICSNCCGKHRVIVENGSVDSSVCDCCNENGLITCPYCC